MSSGNSFDLDINNYTIGELIKFFKLNDKYSYNDLNEKEGELINSILKVYNDTDVVYRNEIVKFIKTGKQILYGRIQTNNNDYINNQTIQQILLVIKLKTRLHQLLLNHMMQIL